MRSFFLAALRGKQSPDRKFREIILIFGLQNMLYRPDVEGYPGKSLVKQDTGVSLFRFELLQKPGNPIGTGVKNL